MSFVFIGAQVTVVEVIRRKSGSAAGGACAFLVCGCGLVEDAPAGSKVAGINGV